MVGVRLPGGSTNNPVENKPKKLSRKDWAFSAFAYRSEANGWVFVRGSCTASLGKVKLVNY